jgi:hypothetical protein
MHLDEDIGQQHSFVHERKEGLASENVAPPRHHELALRSSAAMQARAL